METLEWHPEETKGKPNQAVCHETDESRNITSEARTHSPRQPNSTDIECIKKIKNIHIINC